MTQSPNEPDGLLSLRNLLSLALDAGQFLFPDQDRRQPAARHPDQVTAVRVKRRKHSDLEGRIGGYQDRSHLVRDCDRIHWWHRSHYQPRASQSRCATHPRPDRELSGTIEISAYSNLQTKEKADASAGASALNHFAAITSGDYFNGNAGRTLVPSART